MIFLENAETRRRRERRGKGRWIVPFLLCISAPLRFQLFKEPESE